MGDDFHTNIAPYIPVITVIASGLLVGWFAVWNRRRGSTEAKIPSVSELWTEQRQQEAELDLERGLRRWLENHLWTLKQAFRGYATRVQSGGSTELTTRELNALDATTPNLEEKEK